jgi:hypothetical protein
VLSGTLEVLVPAQQGRIYFADHPRDVYDLLELLIGLEHRQHRLRDPQGLSLAQRVAREAGVVLSGARGDAEVYPARPRPRPLFSVGQAVHFFGLSSSYRIEGIGLYEDYRRVGQTTWAYYYAGAVGAGRPILETQTTTTQPQSGQDAKKGPAD